MRIEYITQARMPTEKAHGLQIAHMCNAFAELGHEVVLSVPKRGNPIKESLFSYYGLKESFKVRYLAAPDLVSRFGKYGFLVHWVHSMLFVACLVFHRPDRETLIYTRSAEVAWLYTLRGYRVVCEVHDWPESFQSAFAWLLRRVDLIPCNSPGTEAACMRHGLVQTLVAHNGIALEEFSRSFEKGAMRKELGLPNDKKIVMYIGALQTWKGILSLCEASLYLRTDTLIVVIGGTQKEVEELRTRYPLVRFLGSRPYRDLAKNQAVADILTVPNIPQNKESVEYTSPIKLFAHMMSGIPMVISDIPSLRAIVGEDQAFFFTPGDARSLSASILYALEHEEEGAAKATRAHEVGELHTWGRRAESILCTLHSRNLHEYRN